MLKLKSFAKIYFRLHILCLFINLKSVYIIDFQTGKTVDLCPNKKLISKCVKPSSIVDWQTLETESMVSTAFDNTLSASVWGHRY